jgi:tetratricopeptide (TPR) repeat protein
VYRVADINANRNVAGGGINIAQRVMDCGDAGHILVSSTQAEVLGHVSCWSAMLHDLGEAEVKHGVRVHLYNLYNEQAGNPELPKKISVQRAAPSEAATKVRKKNLLSIVIGGVATLALALVGGWLFYAHKAHALNATDTIVLADFANSTGDPVFEGTLRQGLTVGLAQSPFFNILSHQKIRDTLKLMGRAPDERLTPDVARELCQRTNSKAYLSGSIASLGSQYVIGLSAVNCRTGDSLAQEQVRAEEKERVLTALDEATTKLREKVGESVGMIEKFDVPIYKATTSSLEALKSYSLAEQIATQKGELPSIPFFKRAIELDPNFPAAYAELASMYHDQNQYPLALEYATKAYQLRDRASEPEKLNISAIYFRNKGDVEKENQIYELWIGDYPRVAKPHGDLGVNYTRMGLYDRALGEFQEALRLAPDNLFNYLNLGNVYYALNRYGEAEAVFDHAFARKLDGGDLREQVYLLAFLRGDTTQMAQQLEWAMGKPGYEDQLLSQQSDTEAYYGRIDKARDFSRRAVDSAVRADSKETAALWQVNAALREAELGNAVLAQRGVAVALALSHDQPVTVAAAVALARAADVPNTKLLTEELKKSYPTDTWVRGYWLPTIDAATKINQRQPSQALVDLEAAAPYELGQPTFINYLYPAYVRGQAYLLAHNGAAAAAEFQKLLDHSGIVTNFVTGALVHLQIGRAYAIAGDTAKAKASYNEFLALWKDADPDIPIFKQAKAEYAKLQ